MSFLEPLPETMALKAGKLRWLMVGGIGLVFVVIAVWVIPADEWTTRLLVGGFFGLVVLVSLPGLFGWRSRLELDGQGFTCVSPFRTFRREWSDCSVFAPIAVGLNTFVGFSAESDERRKPMLSGANRLVAGVSGMLPDTYGMKPLDLALLMNRFRARALKLPG